VVGGVGCDRGGRAYVFLESKESGRRMNEQPLGRDTIRIGEALKRCVAHAHACASLYARGRKADALLHAARPITDVLPWLETELRAFRQSLAAFTTGISAMGAGVRRNVRARKLRKVATTVDEAADALLATIVGPQVELPAYKASVGLALLQSAVDAYSRAVQTANLGDYQSARAFAWCGAKSLDAAGAGKSEELIAHLRALEILLPSMDPPKSLARPEALTEVVEEIFRTAEIELDATKPGTTSLEEGVKKLERLLDDVVSSYSGGVPALSARLAASLYLRSFEPVRSQLPSSEEPIGDRLAQLLGIDLRRAINDGVHPQRVAELGAEAKAMLGSLRYASVRAAGRV
jgi:hypothetical protein